MSCAFASGADAQPLPNPRVLPGNEQPPELEPAPTPRAPSLLPPAPSPEGGADPFSDVQIFVWVDAIEIRGNTVLPPRVLVQETRPFVGRRVSNADLLDLQRRLTRLYVSAGYVTSFVRIPDQDLGEGVIRFDVVEGRLAETRITGLKTLAARYVQVRLVPDPDAPLDVASLERRLDALQLDPRIDSVQARISATAHPGFSALEVHVVESDRWRAQLVVANDRPPAIGQTNGRIGLGYSNVSGYGDDTVATGVFSQGLNEIAVTTTVPVNRFDTSVGAQGRFVDSEIVTSVFADDDIAARFWSVSLLLKQPIVQTTKLQWDVGLVGELRQTTSTLGGEPFNTSQASVDGRLRVSVLRFTTDLVYRDLSQVLAVRTVLSVGLPILGASTSANGVDDTRFTSWLGQMQWARRLPWWHVEVLSRFDWQLAWDPLPPIERFAVGGVRSVRGYTENRLVRDNGFSATFETRLPVIRSPEFGSKLSLAAFVDGGRSWSRDRGPTVGPQNLAGAGLGLLASPTSWFDARLYWGAQLISVEQNQAGLQGQGVYFSLTMRRE